MRLTSALVCVIACLGCSKDTTTPEPPDLPTQEERFLSSLHTQAVATVVFGEEWFERETNAVGEIVSERSYLHQFVSISEPETVATVFEELVQLNKHRDEANWTFSGTLPWIVFLRADGTPLCHAMVTCNDSSITIGKNFLFEDDRLYFGTNRQSYAEGINRDFVRLVCGLLCEHAPDLIVRRDKMYRQVGFTNGLYEALGLDIQDIPSNMVDRLLDPDRASRIEKLLNLSAEF